MSDALIDLLRRYSTVEFDPEQDKLELYYDLKLYGDDLEDFLRDVHERLGVDFSDLNLVDYAPGEPGDLFGWFREALTGRRIYQSLTLGDIKVAVEKAVAADPRP